MAESASQGQSDLLFRAEALSSVLRLSGNSARANELLSNNHQSSHSIEFRIAHDLEDSEQQQGQNSHDQADFHEDSTSGDRNTLRRRGNSHWNERTRQQATGMTRRCVCNLGQCASQNYMCKSERRVAEDGTELDAGCFVEETGVAAEPAAGVTESSSNNNANNGRLPSASARRGCIEMLSREKQKLCSNRAGDPVQCCFNEDMCNYPKTFYPPVSTYHNPNVNSHVNRLAFDPSGGFRGVQQPNLDQQIWLRAAVIAVPVCGLMILIVLILVARKLLRTDDDVKESHPKSSSHHNHHTQVLKPAFLEPQEFLLPPDPPHCYACACHNTNSNSNSGGSSPTLHPPAHAHRHACNTTSETEELVSPQQHGHAQHCSCSPATSLYGGSLLSERSFSSIRPPSIMLRGRPLPYGTAQPPPKKFSLLSKLGLRRDNNSSNGRPYNV